MSYFSRRISTKMDFSVCIVLFTIMGPGFCEYFQVNLAHYNSNSPHNVYKSLTSITDSWNEINILNINPDVGFLIIQVHSFLENVTLSYNSTFDRYSTVIGKNIGLVYGFSADKTSFYLKRNVKIKGALDVLLVITLYDETDPVPGGCNLTFDNLIAPYQIITNEDQVIIVNGQPASVYGLSCDLSDKIQVEFYHFYLKQYDHSSLSYFDGISKMLTVEDVRSNGFRVPDGEGYFKYHRLYSNYRGTGEIFAMIGTFGNRSSAYVPAVSYGCDVDNWEDSCVAPVSTYWKFICALLLIFGIFTCFAGHKFFKFTLSLMGFVFGMFVSFVSLNSVSFEERTLASVILGVIFGSVWAFIWWKYGIPLLSIDMAFVLCGGLIVSTIFHAGLADVHVYRSNVNYWVFFVCVVLALLILWTVFAFHSHLFVCSTLGSYAAVVALNHYAGGHLQYIIINAYRRMVVKNFDEAIVDPPFQVADVLQTILWGVMLGFGVYVQWRAQKGKPPFPPHRSGIITAEVPNERTPLITSELPSTPVYCGRE